MCVVGDDRLLEFWGWVEGYLNSRGLEMEFVVFELW